MQRELIVGFGPAGEVTILPATAAPALAPDEARRWLDAQFLALECEPARASGKVLTGDKLVAIAEAAGRQRFEQDTDWAQAFAQAALAAMARPVVHIDVEAGSVRA